MCIRDRARTLDGRTVKFSAVAFPIRDSDKNLWGVAISYDPADQPATEPVSYTHLDVYKRQ